jgi:hypothetical protein
MVGGGGEGVGDCGALKSREEKKMRARCSPADARAPHDRDRDRRKVKWREMTQEQRFKVLENSLKSCEKVLRLLKKPSFLRRARPISRLFSQKPSETEFRKPEIPRLRLKTGDFGLISVSGRPSNPRYFSLGISFWYRRTKYFGNWQFQLVEPEVFFFFRYLSAKKYYFGRLAAKYKSISAKILAHVHVAKQIVISIRQRPFALKHVWLIDTTDAG